MRKRIALTRASLEYTLRLKSLWVEIEEGYCHERRSGAADEAVRKKLAVRILPYQDAVRNYIAGEDALRWMKSLDNNYQRRLLSSGMATLYPTLLPAPDRPEQ